MFDAVKCKLPGADDDVLNSWNVDDYEKTYCNGLTKTAKVVGMFIHTYGSLTSGNDTVDISFIHSSRVSARSHQVGQLTKPSYMFSMRRRITSGRHH